MHSRDSISRPRPTVMLFYVRHRADGRKKYQFDLHDDLLFIPLETSFVLALTIWIGQRRRRFARSLARSVKKPWMVTLTSTKPLCERDL